MKKCEMLHEMNLFHVVGPFKHKMTPISIIIRVFHSLYKVGSKKRVTSSGARPDGTDY